MQEGGDLRKCRTLLLSSEDLPRLGGPAVEGKSGSTKKRKPIHRPGLGELTSQEVKDHGLLIEKKEKRERSTASQIDKGED